MSSLRDRMEERREERQADPYYQPVNWPVIIAVIFVILFAIGMTAFIGFGLTRILDVGIELASEEYEALSGIETVTTANMEDIYNAVYGDGEYSIESATDENGNVVYNGSAATAEYTPGTVSGTVYYSSFSGVTFSAPSGWTLAAGNGTTSEPDLVARDSAGTMSVKIQFFELGTTYNSYSDVIAALKSQVSDQVTNGSVSQNIGGRNCKGFTFQGSSAYSEILGCDVNGFAMIIQIIVPSSSDLSTVVGYFS